MVALVCSRAYLTAVGFTSTLLRNEVYACMWIASTYTLNDLRYTCMWVTFWLWMWEMIYTGQGPYPFCAVKCSSICLFFQISDQATMKCAYLIMMGCKSPGVGQQTHGLGHRCSPSARSSINRKGAEAISCVTTFHLHKQWTYWVKLLISRQRWMCRIPFFFGMPFEDLEICEHEPWQSCCWPTLTSWQSVVSAEC